jgi:hypothetical protein
VSGDARRAVRAAVKHVVDVAKAMGREIATPAEARQILSMPAEIDGKPAQDRILAQLDPALPLESLVSDSMLATYENYEKDGSNPDSLLLQPKVAVAA